MIFLRNLSQTPAQVKLLTTHGAVDFAGSILETIGDRAFIEAPIKSNVTIPKSVKSIGTQAFYGCTAMTSTMLFETGSVLE